ncbi:MAG: Dabb family protein [Porphyromonadaceae bacterium]|jgi:hypothetical protein|nr:Dabb family protein [Porphyromonadaceae bacterium]
MIKHIVLFELAENAEGKTKAENAEIIKRDLEKLKDVIPQILKIEVGINTPDAPEINYDVAIYSEFASMEDLDIYTHHPEHRKVAAYVSKVRTARACVDYKA